MLPHMREGVGEDGEERTRKEMRGFRRQGDALDSEVGVSKISG